MPSVLIFLIFAVFSVAYLKAVLFWVYLWQVKEYRLGRFLAEYGYTNKILRFWIGGGGRKIYSPAWTTKAVLISLISFLCLEAAAILTPFDMQTITIYFYLPLFYIVLYLLLPLFVCLSVVIFKIPTFFVRRSIAGRAAKKIKSMKNLLVIGITGSYGKSSTKEFLAHILSSRFKVVKTPRNVNTEIGISQFVLDSLLLDAEVFIVEMGAYKIGEIKAVCKVVKPKIGILTGISEQHLALFGSLENTKKAKFELIESLPKDGWAFFNGENQAALDLASNWKGNGIIYRNSLFPIIKNLPRHYELNLNGAMQVARYLGMSQKEIDEAVKNMNYEGIVSPHYFGRGGALIINDTYSANPDGVLAALDILAAEPQRKKIVVMPCLIELGEAASQIHERIGRKINEVCDLAVITTYDYFNVIKKEAGDKVIFENSFEAIKSILDKKLNKETAVLLEGRLAPEIIAYFSESSAVKKYE